MELILPDCLRHWLCVRSHDRPRLVRTDGGLDRWLYRLARKHGRRQDDGWSFDLVHLHAKSGIVAQLKHFGYDVRQIVQRCQIISSCSRVIPAASSG
ncbi:replication initiator protein A [Bradyrhizobium sp. INPA03-11B]|uniref:replication initiator protein A n=1 Tax=Bradyrhizobium sp. INPA03-11B TaxID=418598 RepID=UPI00338D666B